MKYKLINSITKKETLCDKITIDGYDYYVSDEVQKKGEPIIHKTLKDKVMYAPDEYGSTQEHWWKVIATNNPNIGIPIVVDEVEILAHRYFSDERFKWEQENPNGMKSPESLIKHYDKTFTPIYKAGYKKAKETCPFSEDDMIEFSEWCANSHYHYYFDGEKWSWGNSRTQHYCSTKELLQIWKEQQPKSIWYE